MSETGELPITPPPPKSPAGNAPTAPAATGISLANLGGRSPDRAAGQEQGNGQPTPEKDTAAEEARAAEIQKTAQNQSDVNALEAVAGKPPTNDGSDEVFSELTGGESGADIQRAAQNGENPAVGEGAQLSADPSLVPPASEEKPPEIARVPVLTADANPIDPTSGDSAADVDQSQQASGEKLPDDNTSAIPGDEIDASVTPPPGSPPPVPPAGGEPPTNGQPDGAEPASLPGSPEDATQSVEPGAPPPDAEDGESGSENGEIEPAPDQGNEGTTQQNPDSPRDENTVKAEIEGKIDDLAAEVQRRLNLDPRDPNSGYDQKFNDAYNQIRDQLVSQDLQQTAHEMSNGLDDRINKARENEQLTLAHILEERRDRIAEMNGQAHRQAALELLNNSQFSAQLERELIDVNGANPEMVREVTGRAKSEADARRALATEEIKVEGKAGTDQYKEGTWKYIDKIAENIDAAKKEKKPGTEMLERQYLDTIQRRLRAEAMEKLTDDTASPDDKVRQAAEVRVKKLLELAQDRNNFQSKNPLLTAEEVVGKPGSPNSPDQRVAFLRQLAKREYVLSSEEGRLLVDQRKPAVKLFGKKVGGGTLRDIADKIDQASGFNEYSDDKNIVKFADAQGVFEAIYAKELANLRQIAALNAEKRFNKQEADTNLSTIAREDIPHIREKLKAIIAEQSKVQEVSEQAQKDAQKQIKQKFGSYGRRLKHSWSEWRKNNTPETRRELRLSLQTFAKEGAITFLKWWLIWQAVMYLTIIAVEMRMAGKIFGQDGKG